MFLARGGGMTTLAKALDPDALGDALTEAVGVPPCHRGSWSAEVISHKRGKRWTIHYVLADNGRIPNEPAVAVIGKLYVRRERAAALVRHMKALRSHLSGPDRVRIPAPLSVLRELGLAFQECAPGRELRSALLEGTAGGAVTLAAQWLAALHGARPLGGLPVKTLPHEVRKVAGWVEQVAPVLPRNEGRQLRHAEREFRALASGLASPGPAMTHRDFYYRNLFWDGERLWVLDLDDLSIGDPALDVGHFLTHLEKLAYLTTGRTDALAAPGRTFLEAYVECAPLDRALKLPLFRGYTFLKLAATEVQRQVSEWQRAARVFSARAYEEIQWAARR
jgi:aminoglycoside phosphotransferase (APT) family kinase protein